MNLRFPVMLDLARCNYQLGSRDEVHTGESSYLAQFSGCRGATFDE